MSAAVRHLVADVDRAVASYVEHLGSTQIDQMGAAFAAVAAMRDAGVTCRNAMGTRPGCRQNLVEDPDGNVIELFEARR